MMISKRIGMIPITFCMVEHDAEFVSSCFNGINFLPLQINTDYGRQRLEYIGVSPEFPEVPEGCCAPEYGILRSQADDKEPRYEVKIK